MNPPYRRHKDNNSFLAIVKKRKSCRRQNTQLICQQVTFMTTLYLVFDASICMYVYIHINLSIKDLNTHALLCYIDNQPTIHASFDLTFQSFQKKIWNIFIYIERPSSVRWKIGKFLRISSAWNNIHLQFLHRYVLWWRRNECSKFW